MKTIHKETIQEVIADLEQLIRPKSGLDIDLTDALHTIERSKAALDNFPTGSDDDEHLKGMLIYSLRGYVLSGACQSIDGLKIYMKVREACSALAEYCPTFLTRLEDTHEELIAMQRKYRQSNGDSQADTR